MATEAEEARALIAPRMAELRAQTMNQLHRWETREEKLITDSGRRFVVKTEAFWDTNDWESLMCLSVRVRPLGSWRVLKPYSDWEYLDWEDPDDQGWPWRD